MSYAKLGVNCCQQTYAITSNHKYLKPDAKVYDAFCTNMMQYPAQDSSYLDDNIPLNVENLDLLKSYYSKNTKPYGPWKNNDEVQIKLKKNCTSCNMK